jgi:hypothetical protein
MATQRLSAFSRSRGTLSIRDSTVAAYRHLHPRYQITEWYFEITLSVLIAVVARPPRAPGRRSLQVLQVQPERQAKPAAGKRKPPGPSGSALASRQTRDAGPSSRSCTAYSYRSGGRARAPRALPPARSVAGLRLGPLGVSRALPPVPGSVLGSHTHTHNALTQAPVYTRPSSAAPNRAPHITRKGGTYAANPAPQTLAAHSALVVRRESAGRLSRCATARGSVRAQTTTACPDITSQHSYPQHALRIQVRPPGRRRRRRRRRCRCGGGSQ